MKLSRPKPFVPPAYADEAERRARAAALTAAGDPRGRFMTVQLDLALRGPEASAETYDLACEELRLLVRHKARWLAEAGLAGEDGLTWFRGAPERLTLTGQRFLQVGPAVLRSLSPCALDLSAHDEPVIAALAGCPEAARLEELDLRFLSATEAEALAGSPYLGGLRVLEVSFDADGARVLGESTAFARLEELHCASLPFDGVDFALLARAPWFRRLRVLRLDAAVDGAAIVQALASAPHPPQLRSLQLAFNALRTDSIERLAAWPGLATVEDLSLQDSDLVDEDVRVLLASPHLRCLTSLALGPDRLTSETVRTLAGWPGLPGLCSLYLDEGESTRGVSYVPALCATKSFGDFRRLFLRDHLSVAGLDALQAWPPLAGFDTLQLWSGANDPRGDDDSAALAALGRSPYLSSLVSLELVFMQIDAADGLAALLACPSLRKLERLVIRQSGVLDDVTAVIAAWPFASTLETLVIEHGEIGEAGAEAIAASPWLSNLRCLSLAQNAIDAPGAIALAASPHLRKLEVLDVNGNPIGDEGGKALAQAFAKPPVRFLDLRRCDLSTVARDAIVDALPADGPHLSVDSDAGTEQGMSSPMSPRGAGTVSFGSWGYLAYSDRYARRRGAVRCS